MAAGNGYCVENLTDSQATEFAREAFRAANDARKDLELRKLRNYRQYRRYSSELAGGGIKETSRGQFGWSKITVPIVYWIVETILPRLVLNMPNVVVTAASPSAVAYAQAKQMRIQRQMKRAGMNRAMVLAIKSMLVYGDGFTKTTWNRYENRPNFMSVPWADFFVSEEARSFNDAEWIFHRTWYTPRDLIGLSRVEDSQGKPVWRNLEQTLQTSGSQYGSDDFASDRREASGMGAISWSSSTERVEMLECWHRDGSLVVLGGSDQSVLVRSGVAPYVMPISYNDAQKPPNASTDWEIPAGLPWRPFGAFSNSPDLEGPYSISDAEMQEDYQHEASTIRRQGTDQVTANIFSPVVFAQDIGGKVIDRAFSQPGGKIPANGDVRAAVMRLAPGQVSQDVERLMDMIRQESQLVAGVSDFSLGQVSGPGLNTTATGIRSTIEEANQRWRFKVALVEDDMAQVACMIDWLDRQYGGKMAAPINPALSMLEGQQGFDQQPNGLLMLNHDPNHAGAEYDIAIEAGSLTPASKREESQNLLGFVAMVASNPMLAQQANWPEIMRQVVVAHGYDPERMISKAPPMPPPGVAAPGAPGTPNAAGGNGAGLVPIGRPQLVGP